MPEFLPLEDLAGLDEGPDELTELDDLPDVDDLPDIDGLPDFDPLPDLPTPEGRDPSGPAVAPGKIGPSFSPVRLIVVLLVIVGGAVGGWWYAVQQQQVQAADPSVVVTSHPQAQVYAEDGSLLGTTPLDFSNKPGTYQLTLKAEEHEPNIVTVTLSEEQTQVGKTEVTLKALFGWVEFAGCPEGTRCSIDGKALEELPERLKFDLGKHTAQVTFPDEPPVDLEFELGERVSIMELAQAQLQVRPELVITVEGPDSFQASLAGEKNDFDEELEGLRTARFVVPEKGYYQLEVTAEGWKPVKRWVVLYKPEALTVTMELASGGGATPSPDQTPGASPTPQESPSVEETPSVGESPAAAVTPQATPAP